MWTNRKEALHALSVAQGCYVPAEIDESFARGDAKPQSSTEDNFIEGDDTYESVDPDCGLIRQMLKTINGCKEEEIIEQEKEVSSNLNPFCEEFVPQSETQIKRSKPIRPRLHNVAMSSILSNLPSFSENDKKGTFDIKSCSDNLVLNPHNGLKKVNDGKVEKETVNVKSYGDNNFSINPKSMFRRKTVKPSENNNCNNSKANEAENKAMNSPVINNYKASPLASNYYKKFKERQEKKKQEEMLKEDIWTKLERQMKDIDRKRKLVASASSPSNSEDSEISIRNIEDIEGTAIKTKDSEGTAVKTEDPEGTAIKTEDPKGNAIKTEDPKRNAIKTEDPKGTVIKTEDPKGNAIKTEDPKGNAIKTEDPKGNAIKTEDPKRNAIKTEDPKGTVIKTEDPKGNAIKTEDPKGTAINTEDPKGNAIKTKDLEGTAIKTEDLEGTAIKTEDLEGTIINWRNSEGSVVSHCKDEIQHNENWRNSQASPSNYAETDRSPVLKVTLPQHRHLLSDACVVCEIICDKYKIINKMEN